MSMMGGTPPVEGEKVAEYPAYESAQKAVSTLIAADVPAREIAIVGYGLRSVETVTGRLGYAAAARTGAVNGILLGLVFSLIFVFGTPNAAIQLFLGVMFVGIAIGMLMSIITYSLLRWRRDFASVTQVLADHYEVTVQSASVARARQALGVAAAPTPAPVVISDEPPRYGERIDPAAPPARPAFGPGTTPGGSGAAPSGEIAPGPGTPESPTAPTPPAPGPDLPAAPPLPPTEPGPPAR